MAIFFVVNSASGQTSLLENWTAAYLHRGWTPSWMVSDHDLTFPKDVDFRFALGSAFDRLSLGRGAVVRQGRSWMRFQQPLGNSRYVFRAGLVQQTRSLAQDTEDQFLETPFNLSVDAGLESSWDLGRLGDVALSAVGGWDRGPSWSVGFLTSSSFHRVQVLRWHTGARPLTLSLPTENVTDVAVENAVRGLLIQTDFTYLLGAVRPSLGFSLERHEAKRESIDRQTYLTLSPGGSLEIRDLSFSLEAKSAGVGVGHRRQVSDLDGPFLRRSESVGKLFFGRSRFTRLALELWRTTPEARWSLQAGADKSEVSMSARLETWPFVALWEQLGVTAFRYRGGLSGTTKWLQFARTAAPDNHGSFSWAASAGLHRLETSQEDWLVTSLGFGRAEQDSTGTSVEPAVLVRLEASRSFSVTSGVLRLLLSVALPVYAETEGTSGPDTGGSRGRGGAIPGEIRLGASWWH